MPPLLPADEVQRQGATRTAEECPTVARMCADGNEAEVGEGIHEAITLGLVTR